MKTLTIENKRLAANTHIINYNSNKNRFFRSKKVLKVYSALTYWFKLNWSIKNSLNLIKKSVFERSLYITCTGVCVCVPNILPNFEGGNLF